MNNQYLQELITEASARGGGLLLNLENKPAAVVLTVEKYNQLISSSARVSLSVNQQDRLKILYLNQV